MKQNTSTGNHLDIYKAVTSQIITSLGKGELPWRQVWTAAKGKKHPYTNAFTGKPYSFINTLLLGTPGEYATFKQIKEAGGHVLKGHKGRMVIYWGDFVPKENKEEFDRLEKEGKPNSHLKIKFPKYYTVFNIDLDAEGVRRKKEDPAPVMEAAADPTAIADMVIDDYSVNEQVDIEEADGLSPDYLIPEDKVTMPVRQAFTYEEDYYATLVEQLIHSTATEKRLDRKSEMKTMTEGQVSVKEELIAEIGSSMVLSVAGMKRTETHQQIAAMCQKWIREFNNDFRLIVQASYGAEKAAKLILGDFAQ